MSPLIQALFPELILIAAACALILMGACPSAKVRRATPIVALLALLITFIYQLTRPDDVALADDSGTVRIFNFAQYVKMLASGVGMLFVLLAWPSDREGTGNPAIDYATEAG